MAGVAPMTVSRVLNQPEMVAPETKNAIEKAIKELHYVPNRIGQGLRNKQTMVIALVVSDISNPFGIQQVLGVNQAALNKGFSVVFVHTNASAEVEMSQLLKLVERRVDGIVLSPVLNTPDATDFIKRQGLPVVVLDYPMPQNDVDIVRCDSVEIGKTLTDHLISLGHTNIAMLSGPKEIVTAKERAEGYEIAMKSAGLSPSVFYGEYSADSGFQMAQKALASDSKPTAFVTANNFIALGAARGVTDMGLEIPLDISITTCDSVGEDIVFDPFFTALNQPVNKIASIATEMLIERINGEFQGPGREVILESSFVEHHSTGQLKS